MKHDTVIIIEAIVCALLLGAAMAAVRGLRCAVRGVPMMKLREAWATYWRCESRADAVIASVLFTVMLVALGAAVFCLGWLAVFSPLAFGIIVGVAVFIWGLQRWAYRRVEGEEGELEERKGPTPAAQVGSSTSPRLIGRNGTED